MQLHHCWAVVVSAGLIQNTYIHITWKEINLLIRIQNTYFLVSKLATKEKVQLHHCWAVLVSAFSNLSPLPLHFVFCLRFILLLLFICRGLFFLEDFFFLFLLRNRKWIKINDNWKEWKLIRPNTENCFPLNRNSTNKLILQINKTTTVLAKYTVTLI